MDTLKVEHHITVTYNPQSNGSVEITNKAIIKALRQVLSHLEVNTQVAQFSGSRGLHCQPDTAATSANKYTVRSGNWIATVRTCAIDIG